mgnify:CR=1 FL=1
MSLARVDRVASAAARLPGYLRKTRWLELLGAVAAEVQEVEDMWLAMLASNAIDDATGAQLDQIGGLVAQPRGGASDDDYRRRIRAKVATNRSMGLVGDILRLARLVVNDSAASINLENEGTASYVLRLHAAAVPDATATDLAAFVRKATSAGVRGVTEYATVADDDAFILDGPAGLPSVTVPTMGFGTTGTLRFDTRIGIRPEWLDDAANSAFGAVTFEMQVGATFAYDESDPNNIVLTAKDGADTIDGVENAINTLSTYLFVVSTTTTNIGATIVATDAFGGAEGLAGSSPGGALATALE